MNKKYLPIIIAIDNSFSTNKNGAIKKINDSLKLLINKMNAMSNEFSVINMALVSFNSVTEVLMDFTPASEIKKLPILKATGLTNLGEALGLSVNMMSAELRKYQINGYDFMPPIILVLTDGLPNDNLDKACARIEDMKINHNLKLWIIATDDADVNLCKTLTDKVKFIDNNFYEEIFNSLYEGLLRLSTAAVHEDTLELHLEAKENQSANEIPADWLL